MYATTPTRQLMIMRKTKELALTVCVVTASALAGCNSQCNGAISVHRDMINAGSASVGDTVCATFRFRNTTGQEQTVTFLPECDCTTVSPESMSIGLHRTGRLEVRVAVESPGEFIKYVFVETSGSDDFFTVTVRGRGK